MSAFGEKAMEPGSLEAQQSNSEVKEATGSGENHPKVTKTFKLLIDPEHPTSTNSS